MPGLECAHDFFLATRLPAVVRRHQCGGRHGSARPDGARGQAATRASGRTPDDVARGRRLLARDSQAFTLDRTIVNLNNGGVCPSPRVVHEALKRYLDISNQAPVYHMWQVLEPNIETVRRRLAADVRLRRRGARDHAQRQRGAADRAARHRPQGRRRGPDDEPGLPAHARHLAAARRGARGSSSSRSRFPCRRPTRPTCCGDSSRRSRRGRR